MLVRSTEIEMPNPLGHFPKWQQWQGAKPSQSQKSWTQSVPPTWMAGTYLSQYQLLLLVCINKNIEPGAEPGLEPRYSDMGYGRFKWCLNCCDKCSPWYKSKQTVKIHFHQLWSFSQNSDVTELQRHIYYFYELSTCESWWEAAPTSHKGRWWLGVYFTNIPY